MNMTLKTSHEDSLLLIASRDILNRINVKTRNFVSYCYKECISVIYLLAQQLELLVKSINVKTTEDVLHALVVIFSIQDIL